MPPTSARTRALAVDDHTRSLQRAAAEGAVAEAAADGVGGGALHVAIDRHLDDEVGRLAADGGARLFDGEIERVAHGALGVRALDDADALARALRRAARRVMKPASTMASSTTCWRSVARSRLSVGAERDGAFGKPGQHRRFGERQLAGGLAEEAARGGVDAVGLVAEIDAVEVEFENLVLGQPPLDARGQHHFAQLAVDGLATASGRGCARAAA